MLASRKNLTNNYQIYVYERLLKHNPEVKGGYAEECDHTTTTLNSQVKVIHRDENDTTRSYPVNNKHMGSNYNARLIKPLKRRKNNKDSEDLELIDALLTIT